jgi:hypothetical protein
MNNFPWVGFELLSSCVAYFCICPGWLQTLIFLICHLIGRITGVSDLHPASLL